MNEQGRSLRVGDSVVVKEGVRDLDSGLNIGGWQGRISEIEKDEQRQTIIRVRWDSITLRNMPRAYLEESEEQGFDWQSFYLSVEDVTLAESRDTAGDVKRVADEISKQVGWYGLGEEGKRIQQVVGSAEDEWEALESWESHLRKSLMFPFAAEVSEPQRRGGLRYGEKVTVKRLSGLDDLYGVIVEIRRGREKLDFPLCDLEVTEKKSANKQLVADYAVWFANR